MASAGCPAWPGLAGLAFVTDVTARINRRKTVTGLINEYRRAV